MTNEEAVRAAAALQYLIDTPFEEINSLKSFVISPHGDFNVFWNTIEPVVYDANTGASFRELAKLAKRLHCVPASEAAVERVFSFMKMHFSDKRTRCTKETIIINEIRICESQRRGYGKPWNPKKDAILSDKDKQIICKNFKIP